MHFACICSYHSYLSFIFHSDLVKDFLSYLVILFLSKWNINVYSAIVSEIGKIKKRIKVC